MSVSAPTPVVFNRFHARALGLDVVPGAPFAIPVPRDCVGVCIGCGDDIGPLDDFMVCECWSSESRTELPALIHQTCFEEARSEW